MILRERTLEFDFSKADSVIKFDDNRTHGLLHCSMKAVDFIVEFKNVSYYIEVKDPQDPNIPHRHIARLLREFSSARFIDRFINKLAKKYRDSFLYQYAMDNYNKPIYYFVLLALDSLQAPVLSALTMKLARAIPVKGPRNTFWKKTFIEGCSVFNIATWNQFNHFFPVKRIITP